MFAQDLYLWKKRQKQGIVNDVEQGLMQEKWSELLPFDSTQTAKNIVGNVAKIVGKQTKSTNS